jgi:hypothetical protein
MRYFIVIALVLIGLFAHASEVPMSATVRFNNDNIHSTSQPAPINGGWDFGDMKIIPLEQGKTLMVYRYILEPEYNVSIWRYEIDDAYWFVTNRGVIYGDNSVGVEPMASTSLQALSIYLTL